MAFYCEITGRIARSTARLAADDRAGSHALAAALEFWRPYWERHPVPDAGQRLDSALAKADSAALARPSSRRPWKAMCWPAPPLTPRKSGRSSPLAPAWPAPAGYRHSPQRPGLVVGHLVLHRRLGGQ